MAAADQPKLLDWQRLMTMGFGLLRLSAHDFWTMTPREIRAALAFYAPTQEVPTRGHLNAMMRDFPDTI